MFKLLTVAAVLFLNTTQAEGEKLIDPTQPPLQPAAERPSKETRHLLLQGVFAGPRGNQAIIDGQVLHVGDQYEDSRILAISSKVILIERAGKRESMHIAMPILKPSR